uniref:Uncharacterized protein n=1 Tax=Romanomermis culicivorax TaxID=13658 RepID=A0A915KL68_ROMCU
MENTRIDGIGRMSDSQVNEFPIGRFQTSDREDFHSCNDERLKHTGLNKVMDVKVWPITPDFPCHEDNKR